MIEEINEPESEQVNPEQRELSDRREFLCSLGKWSTAAIAAMLLTGSSSSGEASSWADSSGGWLNRGGGWINRGGGGWLNGRGGGGSWVNKRGW